MRAKPPGTRTPIPQFLKRKQVAQSLGTTVQYVDALLARGVLSTYRFGRSVRVRSDEFDAWLEQRRERTQT